MEKRLIPYSVHLPEDLYKQLKAAAGQRKASALVRDAITLIVEGDDSFNGGYNKAVRDCKSLVAQDEYASAISFRGELLSDRIESSLDDLIISQNINPKKKK